MVDDMEFIADDVCTVVRSDVVVNTKQRVLNIVAVDAFGICRVEDVRSVDDELVAVQTLGYVEVNRPYPVGQNHVQGCAPIPLANQLNRTC